MVCQLKGIAPSKRVPWALIGLPNLAIGAFAAVILGLPSLVDGASSKRAIQLLTEAAIADPHNETIFEAYLKTLPNDTRGNYFVEGDLRKTRDEVRTYLEDRASGGLQASEILPNSELKLALNPDTGDRSFWSKGNRALTYSIDASTFTGSNAASRMSETLEAMSLAITDWVNACLECGISIDYVEPENAGQFFEFVTFVVEHDSSPFGPIARAFFPHEPKSERRIVVFQEFFSPSLEFSQRGILRHELGHVLGYRHEHIEDIPGCARENDHWVRVTEYNPQSTMHYPCGGGEPGDLEISDLDIRGHRCVYLHNGPPCPPG